MRTNCRISGKPLTMVADLGNLYVSGFFKEVTPDAPRAPLSLGLGEESGLLQLFDTVDPNTLYKHYWYRSGTNATMTQQLKDITETIPRWIKLKDDDIVLDIGCNDGTLLNQYPQDVNVVKVGIDPAENLAELGRLRCDLHATDYFTRDTYLSLTGGKRAKVITSLAMFYDLDDPHRFVEDIGHCLDDDGIWIVQLSYTPLMLKQNAFDNICHEHLEYYTLLSMDYLLKQHGFNVLDVELNNTNSGSFILAIAKNANLVNEAAVFDKDIGEYRYRSLMSYEKQLHLDEPQAYHDFMKRIDILRSKTVDFLKKLARDGKTVFGYGASTKGNTLLQYYGIRPDLVKCIAERQQQKFGLLTAGSWIPIVSEEDMRKSRPDFLFVLPWHFLNYFCLRERDYLNSGGKFIVPLPELMVIG